MLLALHCYCCSSTVTIAHGRAPLLTPEDEHEGSQGKQSVEGRHLLRQVASGAERRDSLGQELRPLRCFRGNPSGRTAPRGRLSGWKEGPRRCLGRLRGAVEWAALSAGSCPSRPPRLAVENQHPLALWERAAGTRLSTADSTFLAHPGT